MKHKILSLLVLLLTAASGAWADWNGGTYTATATETIEGTVTVSNATLTINENVTVTVDGGITISGSLTVTGGGTLVVNGTAGSNGGDNMDGNGGNGIPGGIAITGTLTVQGGTTVQATGGKGGNGGYSIWNNGGNGAQGGAAISGTVIIQGGATVTATGGAGGNGGGSLDNMVGQSAQGGAAIDGGGIVIGATLTATGGAGGSGGYSMYDSGGNGGNGGNAFAGTLTYNGGTVTAEGGNGGNAGGGAEGSGQGGYAGNAFVNSVDFIAAGVLTDGTNPITASQVTSKKKVVITPKVLVNSVTLSQPTEDLAKGDFVALTATIDPNDATDQTVKWNVTAGADNVKLYKDAACNTEVGTAATDVLTVYAKGLAVGEATVTVTSNDDDSKTASCTVTVVTSVDIDTDADQEGDYFTTVDFTMPDFDATVKYTIVRNMEDADYPVTFSGVNEIIAVKQNTSTSKYEPINAFTPQLIDNISGTDVDIINAEGITIKVFKGTDNNGTITYGTTYMTFDAFKTDMQPGYYKIVAEPTDAATSPYTGSVSVETQVLVGLPVGTLANGQFGSYFSNLPLYSDDPNVKIYTIKSVTSTAAVLTQLTGVIHSGTPIVVFNNGTEKNVILMPNASEPAGGVPDHYSGFLGTLSTMQLDASTGAQWNFVFNGNSLIYVLEAINIPANRCYLQVDVSDMNTNAHSLDIVFEEEGQTGIDSLTPDPSPLRATLLPSGGRKGEGSIYMLDGRKVTNGQLKKGIYIQNGKKTVIK